MTFKDLLEQFSFDEVAPAFKALWQRNAPEQAARLDTEGWRKIYHSIQEIKPVHSPYYIRLGYRWESCVPMIDMMCADDRHELRCLCKKRQCTMLSPIKSFTLGRKYRYGNRGSRRRKNHAERVGCRITLGNYVLWWYGGDVE